MEQISSLLEYWLAKFRIYFREISQHLKFNSVIDKYLGFVWFLKSLCLN